MSSSKMVEQGSFCYSPPLLPDELLYSWLGRFTLLNALGSPRDCVERIFGSRTVTPVIDLPAHLESIMWRLGDWLPFDTVDQLLEKGTLLPYHRPFLTQARYEVICQKLIHGDGRGIKTLIGRVANRFGANPALRYCVDCVADSFERYGSPYWVRQHQLPGVNCCTRHGIRLQRQLTLYDRTDRQRFIIPTDWRIEGPYHRADERQLRFADLSQQLLTVAPNVVGTQQRSAIYRHAVYEKGFGRCIDCLDYIGLAQAVRSWFEDFQGFEHRERLLAPESRPLAWIKDLIERPARAVHPICHLILIDYLFGSIAGFAAASVNHQVETAIADSYTVPLPSESSQSLRDAERETLLRDISLSCRRVAGLLNKSVTTVVLLRRTRGIAIRERRKSLSDHCIGTVKSELAVGLSPQIVASNNSVSLSTVYRIRSQYLASHPRPDPEVLSSDTLEHRQRWLCALLSHEHGGVRAIRTSAPTEYAWLYRHDHAWLMSTTRTVRRPSGKRLRLDWTQRDIRLCEQAGAYVIALRKQVPPQRVTKTRLIRPLGESMILKNLHQLPLLATLLDRVCESRESFGMRRVDYAITVLANSTSNIPLWRVKRISGLRLWPDSLSAYATQEVEKVNAKLLISHSIPSD